MWPLNATEETTKTTFPDLFYETIQPTIASILVFAFADIRRIARETEDLLGNGNTQVLDLPIPAKEMIQICRDNKEILRPKVNQNTFNTVEYIVKEFFVSGNEYVNVEHVTVQHCGDDNALNECVHAILINDERKQITLTFRGSITMQDWITDAKLVSGDIANPLYNFFDESDDKDQPEFLGVHLGFRDYLYDVRDPLLPSISLHNLQTKVKDGLSKANTGISKGKKVIGDAIPSKRNITADLALGEDEYSSNSGELSSSTKQEDPTNDANNVDASPPPEESSKKNKIDKILDQVQELMDAKPGYKLYITGHSLGGALALLTTVEASVRFSTPNIPVTCVTIANPRVGDDKFRKAIQTLEQSHKLRCLTVHNDMDLVPALPNRLCRGDWCSPNAFCYCGMQLVLKERSFFTKYHSETSDTKLDELQAELRRLLIVLCCWPGMAKQHNYRTYLDRLVEQKQKLSQVYLNDLYKKQGINFD